MRTFLITYYDPASQTEAITGVRVKTLRELRAFWKDLYVLDYQEVTHHAQKLGKTEPKVPYLRLIPNLTIQDRQ